MSLFEAGEDIFDLGGAIESVARRMGYSTDEQLADANPDAYAQALREAMGEPVAGAEEPVVETEKPGRHAHFGIEVTPIGHSGDEHNSLVEGPDGPILGSEHHHVFRGSPECNALGLKLDEELGRDETK